MYIRRITRPILIVLLIFILAACSNAADETPTAEPTAVSIAASTEESIIEPTEEPSPTIEPTEEPSPTVAPTEDVSSTVVPAEEPPVTETAVPQSISNHEIQGFHSFEMTAVDGRTRKYTVYVPWSYDGVTPMPVVMQLHGGADTVEGSIQYQSYTHNWQTKAEQENFLVVYPLGSRPNNDAPASGLQLYEGQLPIESYGPEDIDKWGNPTAWDDRWIGIATGDDVGFIDGLIDQLDADYAVDLNRVYVSGLSNGGMMAWRLAEELNHRIAAVASVVGAHQMPEDAELQRAVPVISIVGDQDDRGIGSFEGGYMNFFGMEFPKFLGSSTWMNPWQDQVDTWVAAIGASPEFEILQDDERVIARVYRGPEGAEFQDWRILDMGHTWPGLMEPGDGAEAANPRSDAVIGEDLIWDFFKKFSLDGSSTGASGGPELILVERPGLFPEGIEYDAANGRFLLGSIGEGSVFAVQDDGTLQAIIEDDELMSTLGVEIDAERNRVLVANSDLAVMADPTAATQVFLGIYDLDSGERLHMVSLIEGEPDSAHLANDVAVDADGNAYVTDTLDPTVYKVDMDGNASVFTDQFGGMDAVAINGIVYHPDGYLLVSVMDTAGGGIVRVPLDNPAESSRVELEQSVIGDGMVLHPNGNLIVVDVGSVSILSLSSDDGWATAVIEASAPNHPASTVALRGEQVYAVYPHFEAMTTGEIPEVFEIVLIEFSE